MMIRHAITGLALVCFGAAAVTGCSRSPRVSFYTLGGAAAPAKADPSQSAPSVSVANITLPDLVDRPQLVERMTGSRVEIRETHRWAEPLKSGISRLLAENLASQLGSNRVTTYPQNAAGDPDYRVFVDIQRFEATGDSVSVDAVWSIRRTTSGTAGPDTQNTCVDVGSASRKSAGHESMPAKTGRSQVIERRGGEGYEALMAAYNRALASVSSDIATSISTEWHSPP